jgi:hypothetical protein
LFVARAGGENPALKRWPDKKRGLTLRAFPATCTLYGF